LEKIKTYLIISDTTSIYDPLIGTQSSFYDIDQFIAPGVVTYNPSTLSPENNDMSFYVNDSSRISDIIDIFIDKDYFYNKKKVIVTVVKFWGNITQEFSFTWCKLIHHKNSNLVFKFDGMVTSPRDNDKNKYWTRMIIPHIRDEKLSKILDI